MDNDERKMGIKWVYTCDHCALTPDKCECIPDPTQNLKDLKDFDPKEFPF